VVDSYLVTMDRRWAASTDHAERGVDDPQCPGRELPPLAFRESGRLTSLVKSWPSSPNRFYTCNGVARLAMLAVSYEPGH
jgi:hypothetical protein